MAVKPVKWMSSAMQGAPVLNGQPGSLIAVLDTLVNGFNLVTLDSLVVVGDVLTGTKAGHGFIVDQVVATTANEAALTGEWTVTSVTANTFTAAAPGVGDVVGTGVRTAKTPGAGWIKAFSGMNKAAYKSGDPTSTGMYLRVDDTGTTFARVRGFETMTDVDTGSGPFPTDTHVAGGGYWGKSDTASVTACRWAIFASQKTFYFYNRHNELGTNDSFCGMDVFGDYPSLKAGDAYNALLQCSVNSNAAINYGYSTIGMLTGLSNSAPLFGAKSHIQMGGAISNLSITSNAGGATNTVSGSSSIPALFPSPVTNGLLLSVPAILEGIDLRGACLPGFYGIPQSASALAHLHVFQDIQGLANRKGIVCHIPNNGNFGVGKVLFDITGPWG